jgi:hypothetical protein
MTLADLDSRMAVGVSRPDIANSSGSYVQFINEAQRELCLRRSWSWMKVFGQQTLSAGSTKLVLPSLLKELSDVRTPVHVLIDGTEYPIEIWTLEKHKRRAASKVGTEIVAHLEDANEVSSSTKSLDFIIPFDTDMVFTIRYYGYLPDLALPSGSNPLTRRHPDLLLSLAKARAFFAVNDPAGAEHLSVYEQLFRQAAAADGYAQLAGTNLRM